MSSYAKSSLAKRPHAAPTRSGGLLMSKLMKMLVESYAPETVLQSLAEIELMQKVQRDLRFQSEELARSLVAQAPKRDPFPIHVRGT